MPRLVLAALAAAVATLGSASAAAIDNVVFVLLDDLDLQLGGLTPMKRVRSILQDGGTTFTHATVNTPVVSPGFGRCHRAPAGPCTPANSLGAVFAGRCPRTARKMPPVRPVAETVPILRQGACPPRLVHRSAARHAVSC